MAFCGQAGRAAPGDVGRGEDRRGEDAGENVGIGRWGCAATGGRGGGVVDIEDYVRWEESGRGSGGGGVDELFD